MQPMLFPNLRHLRVFAEVAQSGSISQAANRVFLSQPAMTQAIAKLEGQLDAVLFDRQSSGMYLTREGEIWLARVKRCLDWIQLGLTEIQGTQTTGRQARAAQQITQISSTQLRALMAVTDRQNFTLASRDLGISQSSLHRSARDLEGSLGISLFEKTSTGIAATRPARILTQRAKLAVAEIAQGVEELSAARNRERGRLRIGSMPLARTSLLPMAINRFTAAHPGLTLELVDGPYEDLLGHLINADLDVVVGALRSPAPTETILQRELIAPPLAIIGRADHPLRGANNLTVQQLATYPWVVPREGTPTREFFNSHFAEPLASGYMSLVETTSHVLTREVLLGSDRLTLVSRHQLEHEIQAGQLAVMPYALSHTRRSIGFMQRRDWKATTTQQKFIDILQSCAAEYADI